MNPGTGIFNEMRLNRHRFYGTKFHVRAEVMDALKKDTEETSALDGLPAHSITVMCKMRKLFISLSFLVLTACSQLTTEIGDCYYYEHEGMRRYFALVGLKDIDNTRLITIAPVLSSSDEKLVDATLLTSNKVTGDKPGDIWISVTQVDERTFKKISKDFHYEGKVTIPTGLKTKMGLAPSDFVQFRFIDNLIRTSNGDKIKIEKIE